MSTQDTTAQDTIREFEQLASHRGVWESHWREVAQLVMPSAKNNFNLGKNYNTPGEKKTQFQFDSTAAMALNRFGAILDSLLTPRNQTWHRLMASDSILSRNRQVKLYFEEVNRILFKYRYAPESNFSSQNQQNYKSLGAFGNGAMYVDELKGKGGIRYRAIHLGEIFFSEDHQGMVDRAYRRFRLTARQAVQQFGKDTLPDQISNSLESNPERQFDFIHCVKPQKDYEAGRLDSKGMPFSSEYISIEGAVTVAQGGYKTFPFAISRYEQAPNEVYGRGPAMDVLPAIKMLQEQKKTMIKQGHRAVDPILLAHDDGIAGNFFMRPGAINGGAVTADGRPLVHALPTGNIAAGKEMMDDERQLINDAFLISLFQILTENPQMTATEVMERTREKGILLAPTVGRQQSEYLGPMVNRELDVLSRQGLLPPMPAILLQAAGEYKLEYDSPLSRIQRSEEAAGVMRTVENALTVVNVTQDPAPLDHFNWDVIIPEIADIQGVPSKWMRDIAEVQQIRQGRSQQKAVAAASQMAPGAAALVKAGAAVKGASN